MPEALPIYSESVLRRGLQFSDLNRLQVANTNPAWESADSLIAELEAAPNVRGARLALEQPAADMGDLALFTHAHGVLFDGREGAGVLRTSVIGPLYRGQDCAPPEFIDRS